MSKKAKKNAPLPASSAGLLRFFEDETKGIKVKPEIILGVCRSFDCNFNSNKDYISSLIFLFDF